MKNSLGLLKKIKSFFQNDFSIQTEKFIIAQQSCPHCANRGMFIFQSNSENQEMPHKQSTNSLDNKFINVLIFTFLISVFTSAQQPGFVSTNGKEIVDANGNSLLLKGINLGNWLVPEGYMFHFETTSSPRMIYDVFNILVVFAGLSTISFGGV